MKSEKLLKTRLEQFYEDFGSKKILENLKTILEEKSEIYNSETLKSIASDINDCITRIWGSYNEVEALNIRNGKEYLSMINKLKATDFRSFEDTIHDNKEKLL